MNKIISITIMSVFLLSLASAALGISTPNEFAQEKGVKQIYKVNLFSYGSDKVSEATLKVISGSECVSVLNPNIQFSPEGSATAELEIDTDKCKDGVEDAKIRLSPVNPITDAGTVGMSLSVAKTFDVTVPQASTMAIVVLAVLLIAIMLLIAAMFKIAKRRN